MYAQTSLSSRSALAKRWPNGALQFISVGFQADKNLTNQRKKKSTLPTLPFLKSALPCRQESETEELNGHETHRLQRDARKPTETMDEAVLQLPTMAITDR